MAKQAKDGRIYRSLEEKKAMVAYVKEGHKLTEAAAKFGVAPSLIGRWASGKGLGLKRSERKAVREAARLVAKEFGHTGNGADAPDPLLKSARAALLHLERWKNAQRAHIRRGGVDNPYDVEAEHAYRVLRGEE